MGRTPKVQPPSDLERAIRAIETKIEALQMALAVLLDVSVSSMPPSPRVVNGPSDAGTAPGRAPLPPLPRRSHRRKTAAETPAPVEQDEKLDL